VEYARPAQLHRKQVEQAVEVLEDWAGAPSF
jgi:hypothetical protein